MIMCTRCGSTAAGSFCSACGSALVPAPSVGAGSVQETTQESDASSFPTWTSGRLSASTMLPQPRAASRSGLQSLLTQPLVKIGLAVAVAMTVLTCGFFLLHGITRDGSRFALTGTLDLTDSGAHYRDGESCYGENGYDDVSGGTGVTVTDRAGSIIGTGKLEEGVGQGSAEDADSLLADLLSSCVFSFSVDELPKTAFYSIEVGRRGKLTYSLADMKQSKWIYSSSIGSP